MWGGNNQLWGDDGNLASCWTHHLVIDFDFLSITARPVMFYTLPVQYTSQALACMGVTTSHS